MKSGDNEAQRAFARIEDGDIGGGLSVHDLDLVGQEVLAMADVRTLDEWAWVPLRNRYWFVDKLTSVFVCQLRAGEGDEQFEATTPDEARAKAAAWVRSLK